MPGSGVSFYGYSSASSHTGFEEVNASKMMLHLDATTGELTLVLVHGIDADSSGIQQPASHVLMKISGPPSMGVALADDSPDEFKVASPGFITGDWSFQSNSDGGVIDGLLFPASAWQVDVSPAFQKGISKWQWIDGSGNFFGLPVGGTVSIRSNGGSAKGTCRTDCSRALCGDGRLDAGETCDDGNTNSGDGCSPGCSLEVVVPD